jgi:hypothetical protein
MKKRLLIVVSLLLMIAHPAFAITAGDVLDRMTEKERGGYLNGLIEMAMYLSGTSGDGKHATCILNWYYNKTSNKALDDTVAAFRKYQDQPAAAIMKALIVRQCGAFPATPAK